MKVPFELEWFGGAAEQHVRRRRSGVDGLCWGTLSPTKYPPALVARARLSWTEAAYNEWCTAVAFTDVTRALLEAQAPVDLIGMASDFILDEMTHVEMTSRVAMELGGGMRDPVDFQGLGQRTAPGLSPLQRASELVVRVCCVGEAFSVPMLAGCLQAATHPLTRSVLEVIVRDEAPHGRFGWMVLDWADIHMDDAERQRLAGVALETLHIFAPYWKRLTSRVLEGVTSEGYLLQHVNELGWMDSESFGSAAREAVRRHVARPLARYGIVLDEPALEQLLS